MSWVQSDGAVPSFGCWSDAGVVMGVVAVELFGAVKGAKP